VFLANCHLEKQQTYYGSIQPPAHDFDHELGAQIPTKHKEAIRQLYGFAKTPVDGLIKQYHLGKSTIIKILTYDAPERARITRTGRPSHLTDFDEIIEYASESFEHRCLSFQLLHDELELQCSVKTLERRLK
jgi:hypothetical protein